MLMVLCVKRSKFRTFHNEIISDFLFEQTGRKFTEDDLDACWPFYKSYMVDILNGDYELTAAREDLAGLVDSAYDTRTPVYTARMAKRQSKNPIA